MKLTAKGSVSQYKKHQHGTGGGPPSTREPTDTDWEIRDLIPYEFEDDVAEFDSDAVNICLPVIQEDLTEYVLSSETGDLIEVNKTNEEATKIDDSIIDVEPDVFQKMPKILRPPKSSTKLAVMKKESAEDSLLRKRLMQIEAQTKNEAELQLRRIKYEDRMFEKLEAGIKKEQELHDLKIKKKKKYY